jgi:NAD+ kinase
MPGDSRRVLIIANLDKDDSGGMAHEMESRFDALGIGSSVFAFSGAPGLPPDVSGFELVVSLGGDGTVLYSARAAVSAGVPVLPFNLGRLGFIAGFQRGDWERVIEAWRDGKLNLSERVMLDISLQRCGLEPGRYLALNDGVISTQGIAKVIGLEVRVAGTSLGTYRSDGVIVATPTGSTAYNLAAGGPAIHPEMDAMVLNPICPFTLWNRPLVVPGADRIDIEVEQGKRARVMLTVDGQETAPLAPGDRVSFVHAPYRARIYAPKPQAFYETLRTKLSWSGGPDA